MRFERFNLLLKLILIAVTSAFFTKTFGVTLAALVLMALGTLGTNFYDHTYHKSYVNYLVSEKSMKILNREECRTYSSVWMDDIHQHFTFCESGNFSWREINKYRNYFFCNDYPSVSHLFWAHG